MPKSDSTYLTPPQYAARLGVAPEKVVGFIRSRELRAINAASAGCSQPRYKITPQAIEEFERRRAVVQVPKPIRRCSRSQAVESFM